METLSVRNIKGGVALRSSSFDPNRPVAFVRVKNHATWIIMFNFEGFDPEVDLQLYSRQLQTLTRRYGELIEIAPTMKAAEFRKLGKMTSLLSQTTLKKFSNLIFKQHSHNGAPKAERRTFYIPTSKLSEAFKPLGNKPSVRNTQNA